MAQTTTNLSSSIQTVYLQKYLMGVRSMRVYDQLAVDYTTFAGGKTMDELMRGSAVQVNFLSRMQPGITAINQTQDVTPQRLYDAVASVTPTSRGEALAWSQQLEIQVYNDYTANAYEAVGMNAQESIELLAQAAALQGSWVERAVARASLDAGTSTHRATDAIFRKYQAMFETLRIPGFLTEGGENNVFSAIMHPFVFHDISEGGNVDSIGLYQDKGIHLNFELGQIGPFRLVSTGYAKVFGAAGADNGTNVATTLNGDVAPLSTTFVTASDVSSNVAAGLFWWLGMEETANTHYATNEPVRPLSASTVTITAMGSAANGGVLYGHSSGEPVRNADSAYTICFGGPQSLVKLYATDVGADGEVVGPNKTGLLEQFNTLGWKYYGGYGRISENRLLRYECSVSYEA